jgi:hypothetical protein
LGVGPALAQGHHIYPKPLVILADFEVRSTQRSLSDRLIVH